MKNLVYKIGCTAEELKQALRLRYEVFNIEIKGESVPSEDDHPLPFDHDQYDDVCEHLVVVNQEDDRVIGTYRMLLDTVAYKNFGFYSETKFNIEKIKKLPGRLLEVGRSCVHKDYRDKSVLNLLWHGICQYVMENNVRYIFGSANIMTDDARKISEYFAMFKALNMFDNLGVLPLDKAHQFKVDEHVCVENPKRIFMNLPTLFKGYMSVGLKVCGYPVLGDFAMVVFPVILDIQNVDAAYRKRFLGDYFPMCK